MADEYKYCKIEALDKDELEDLLASVRYDILKHVKALSTQFRIVMELQERRERIEIRLEELGYRAKDGE